MSVGSVLRYNLIYDYTDSTAQSVYNSYVSAGHTTVFSSSADVPVWMYTSLASILGCTSSELAARVISDEGEAKTPTSPCISIETDEDYEGRQVPELLRADAANQDVAYLDILVKNVKTDKNITLVKNALLRIMYLLDANIRQSSYPIRNADLTINSNEFVQSYFRCYYRCIKLPIASEGMLSVYTGYFWQFGITE